MTRMEDAPIIPLPGQLAFRFMAEPGHTERLEPERRTDEQVERACREPQPGKRPARETPRRYS